MSMNLIEFGIEPYRPMNELQQRIAAWRHEELVDDTLLLSEHTPTITLGRRADQRASRSAVSNGAEM